MLFESNFISMWRFSKIRNERHKMIPPKVYNFSICVYRQISGETRYKNQSYNKHISKLHVFIYLMWGRAMNEAHEAPAPKNGPHESIIKPPPEVMGSRGRVPDDEAYIAPPWVAPTLISLSVLQEQEPDVLQARRVHLGCSSHRPRAAEKSHLYERIGYGAKCLYVYKVQKKKCELKTLPNIITTIRRNTWKEDENKDKFSQALVRDFRGRLMVGWNFSERWAPFIQTYRMFSQIIFFNESYDFNSEARTSFNNNIFNNHVEWDSAERYRKEGMLNEPFNLSRLCVNLHIEWDPNPMGRHAQERVSSDDIDHSILVFMTWVRLLRCRQVA